MTTASCKQPPATVVPVVDFTRCEGKGDCVRVCGLCVAACPEKAITLARVARF